MIIEELNHCGGNIPHGSQPAHHVRHGRVRHPEQIQYAIDYYKENGYPPYCLAISSPRPAPPTSG